MIEKRVEKAPRAMRSKGAQTKALVLETAIKVFSKRSYHNTTVEDVAKAAGLAKGTLYQYFRSKKELLASCLELWHSNMDFKPELKLSEENLKEISDLREFLSQSFQTFFEIYAQNVPVMKVLCKASEEGLDIESAIEQGFYRLVKSYEKIFTQAKEALFIHSDLPVFQNAFFVSSMLYQVAYQSICVEKKSPQNAPFKPLEAFVASALKLS